MKIKIESNKIQELLICLCLVLMMFSSTCLWTEDTVRIYVITSVIVVVVSIVLSLKTILNINSVVNNRYILWVVVIYIMIESYYFLLPKYGYFNWDFVLVSGVLQISATLMLMTLRKKEDVIRVVGVACKISLVVILIYMYITGGLSLRAIALGDRLGNALSGNVNTVATSLGIMILPTFFLVFTEKNKVISLIIIAISSIIMLVTGSKKAVIILMVMLLMYFWIDRKPLKYLIIPIIGIAGIYALFNVPILYDTVGYRIIDMFATLGFGQFVTNATSTAMRTSFIEMGMQSFKSVPLFGGGINYFQKANHQIMYSHNNYVEMLNSFGIVGTTLFYLPWIIIIKDTIKKLKQVKTTDEEERKICIYIIVLLASKFLLDYAMVSFSTMCLFFLPFILSAELYRRRFE